MSLNLKVSQYVSLQDTQVSPTTPDLVSTNFLLSASSYTNYITGDKEVLNAGESITISPTFVTQFIQVTSSLLYDVTITQPGYTRKVQGVSASFPENTFTVTTLQDSWMQFGMFSNIVITSRQNGNKFKWFVMGNDPADLAYVTLTHQTFSSASSPQSMTEDDVVPIFNVPYKQYIYVVGDGGPVTLLLDPAIQPGFYLNQQITVVGTDDTNTVTINSASGTSQNGFVTLSLDDSIDYYWNGSYWSEENRR